MIADLGVVKPGSTIRIPFATFDKDDGSAITMTNFAAADILIYKDGSTTERASTSGYTATTDFDGKTGKHLIVIDLADNTTADFFQAGSEYLVAIDSVTVDSVTVGDWVGRFRIGYTGAVLDTWISTHTSSTVWVLNEGPAEDNALAGMWAIVHDAASKVQHARVLIASYVGSTKTVTLAAAATFTTAVKDNISVMGLPSAQLANVAHGGTAGTLTLERVVVASTTAGEPAMKLTGNTSGAGLLATGGATGHAVSLVGGGTSGNGLNVATTSGHGVNLAPAGTNMHGVLTTGGNGGTSDGVKCVAGTGGVAFRGDITGNITGTLSTVTTLTNLPAITTDWLTATGLAASAVTEIQSGLASATDLATLASYVDTEVAAIKAKTDNLPASFPTNFASMSISAGGVVASNVTQYGGSNGTFASGRPEVNLTHIAGSSVSTSSAQLGVNVVNAAGTAWGSGAITAASIASDAITAAKIADGAIDRATLAADTGLQTIRSGTATAGAAGTITLDGSASTTANAYTPCQVVITGGTGVGQVRLGTAYSTGRVLTVVPNWTTNPDATSTYALLPNGMTNSNVTYYSGTAGTSSGGRPEVNTTHWAATAVGSALIRGNLIQIAGVAVSTTTAQLGVNVVNAAGTAWGSGAITAASIATDAITAAKIATDAVTEIQSGLATAANLATVASYLDTEIAAILADTNELQTDWANGGRLDLILDARASQTSVDTIDTNLLIVDGTVTSISNNIGPNGGFLSAIPWNAAWDAEVQSEVQTVIETNHLDHLLAVTYDPASQPGVADALLNELVESDAGVSRFTANALEQGPSGGSAPSAADIRAEIDANSTQLAAIVADTNELQTDWANGGRLDLILDARASQTSVDTIDDFLDTEVAAIKAKTDLLVTFPSNFSSLVISVGGVVAADVVAISGDSTAADNFETMLDGTGGQTLTLQSLVVNNSSGIGMNISGRDGGVVMTGLTDSAGLVVQGDGLANGASFLAGSDGHGIRVFGGGDSGSGLRCTAFASGYHGIHAEGVSAGSDIYLGQAASSIQAAINTVLTSAHGSGDWTEPTAAEIRSAVGLASANLDTQLSAINSKTTNLPADPADASDIATAFSGVNTKLDTIDNFLDTEVAAIKTVTDNLATAIELDGSVYRFTANALEQGPTNSAASIRAAIGMAAADLDSQIIGILLSIAGVDSQLPTDFNTLIISGGMARADVEQIALGARQATAGTVWDEILSGHVTGGSAAVILSDIVMDTAEIGTAGAGLTALATQASVNTIDDFLDTEIAAIKAKTDNLPSDPADASDIATAFSGVNTKLDTIDDLLDTEVGAIKTVTDNLATAIELDGSVYRFTTNALELAPTGGTAPTAGEIADEIETRTLDANVVSAAGTAWNSGAIGASTLAADTLTAAKVAADVGTEIGTAVWASGTRTVSSAANITSTGGTITVSSGVVSANTLQWRGLTPGNLDSNGFVPANAAAVNGNTTRAVTFSTWLDNNRLDVAVSTVGGGASASDIADEVETRTLLANMVQISGDSVAADKLEAMLDGDGGVTLSLEKISVNNTSGHAIEVFSTAGFGAVFQGPSGGISVEATDNGNGMRIIGSGSGSGLRVSGGVGGDDIYLGLAAANLQNAIDAVLSASHGADQWDAVNSLTAAAVRTEMDANSTKLASIDAKTTNLPSDPADASVIAASFVALAAFVDTEVAAIKVVTDRLDTAIELDGSVYRFTANSLEQSPAAGSAPTAGEVAAAVWTETTRTLSTSGVSAITAAVDTSLLADFAALQSDLDAIQSVVALLCTSSEATENTEELLTAISAVILAGNGEIPVDHNYGGTDAWRAMTDPPDSIPLSGVNLAIYRTSDYDAGNRSSDYIVARTKTGSDGRWAYPVMLDPGEYTVVFSKNGAILSEANTLTVE